MTEIHNRFKDQGFELLAFPCNQFAHQEPGTNAEIKKYVHDTWGATFPLFAKIDVNGDNADPVYKFLRRHSSLYEEKTGKTGEISWNFGKFLVNHEGQVVNYYGPHTDPNDIIPDIQKLLQ